MIPANAALAQTYAANQVPVFPCREGGERAKSPCLTNGFHGASCDLSAIRDWANSFPGALYGLPCAPNGLFVLDADRHGNGDGVENVRKRFAWHGFDASSVPVVRTPRDGLHIIFQRPDGLGKTKGRLADAVDVRDNGYIIAPGNVLPDGRRYSLLSGTIEQLANAIANRSLPMMPDWLIAEVTPVVATAAPMPIPATPDTTTNQLGGLVQVVVCAQPGNRNSALYWASCRVGVLVRRGLIGGDGALAMLVEAGQHAGLGYRESYATALSGIRQGQWDASYGS